MPIEPSALLLPSGGFALAAVNAEMVMQATSERTVDATTAFSQILGSSLVKAEPPSEDSVQGPIADSHLATATVVLSPLPATAQKPTSSSHSADFVISTHANIYQPSALVEPALMNSHELASPVPPAPMVLGTSPRSVNSISEATGEHSETLESGIRSGPLSAVVAGSTLQSQISRITFHSTGASSTAAVPYAARTAIAAVHVEGNTIRFEQLPPALTARAEQSAGARASSVRSSKSQTAEQLIASTLTSSGRALVQTSEGSTQSKPIVSAAAPLMPQTETRTVGDLSATLSGALPTPSASDEIVPELPTLPTGVSAPAAPQSFVAILQESHGGIAPNGDSSRDFLTPDRTGETVSTQSNIRATETVSIAPTTASAWVQSLGEGQAHATQRQEPVFAQASTSVRDDPAGSAAQASPFVIDPSVPSPQPIPNGLSTFAPNQPVVASPSENESLAAPPTTHQWHDSAAMSADPTHASSQSESPISLSTVAAAAPAATLSVPMTNASPELKPSLLSLQTPLTGVGAAPSRSHGQPSGDSISTQTVSEGETPIGRITATFVAAAATQRVDAPPESRLLPTAQSTPQSLSGQGTEGLPAIPQSPGNDNPKAVAMPPAVPAPHVIVSLGQGSTSNWPTLWQGEGIHAGESTQRSFGGNTGIDSPRGILANASSSAPSPSITSTSEPRILGAAHLNAPTAVTPASSPADASAPATDTESASARPADLDTPARHGKDSASDIRGETSARNTSENSETSTDAEASASTHVSHSENNMESGSSAPLTPSSTAGDSLTSTQSVFSWSAQVANLQTAGSTSAGAPASLTIGSNGPALPSAVLARDSAEMVELSTGLQAWNGGDNAQTRLVQTANLGGNLRSSEMNIALQAEALGPVEVRARVAGDVLGASIGVERHDAHAAIVNELPALHQALHDRQLRVGDVSVFQGSVHSGGATGDGRPSHHRETTSQRSATAEWTAAQNSALPEVIAYGEGPDTGTPFDSNGRLSVRA